MLLQSRGRRRLGERCASPAHSAPSLSGCTRTDSPVPDGPRAYQVRKGSWEDCKSPGNRKTALAVLPGTNRWESRFPLTCCAFMPVLKGKRARGRVEVCSRSASFSCSSSFAYCDRGDTPKQPSRRVLDVPIGTDSLLGVACGSGAVHPHQGIRVASCGRALRSEVGRSSTWSTCRVRRAGYRSGFGCGFRGLPPPEGQEAPRFCISSTQGSGSAKVCLDIAKAPATWSVAEAFVGGRDMHSRPCRDCTPCERILPAPSTSGLAARVPAVRGRGEPVPSRLVGYPQNP